MACSGVSIHITPLLSPEGGGKQSKYLCARFTNAVQLLPSYRVVSSRPLYRRFLKSPATLTCRTLDVISYPTPPPPKNQLTARESPPPPLSISSNLTSILAFFHPRRRGVRTSETKTGEKNRKKKQILVGFRSIE